MIRVLITGAGSYLGTAIERELRAREEEFAVETLSLRTQEWQQADFQGYDAVVHVAGIAHRRETEENQAEYYAVNCDLAVAAAEKAKRDGVKQFVFFSTMSVYGLTHGRIHARTPVAPDSYYGKSKWMAEERLAALREEAFQVAILRPPMIYGPGCRGNYPRLSTLVRKLPVFPRVHNERSMLYIDILCAFVCGLLKSGQGGLYFPQNKDYVATDELVRCIAKAAGKRIWQPRGFGWLIGLMSAHVRTVDKLFGTLTYDKDMSGALMQEPQPNLEQTILATEGV